jgi:hypothetical protein
LLSIPDDEEALKDALAMKGPVTVAYDASHDSMTFYSRHAHHTQGFRPLNKSRTDSGIFPKRLL